MIFYTELITDCFILRIKPVIFKEFYQRVNTIQTDRNILKKCYYNCFLINFYLLGWDFQSDFNFDKINSYYLANYNTILADVNSFCVNNKAFSTSNTLKLFVSADSSFLCIRNTFYLFLDYLNDIRIFSSDYLKEKYELSKDYINFTIPTIRG